MTDTYSPREIASRNPGLGYKAVLGAIRRGELRAFVIAGKYRIRAKDYEQWLTATPVEVSDVKHKRKPPRKVETLARLRAIDGGKAA